MDAFLYACAKIIVFNKRAQQFEKYTMYYLLFDLKLEKFHDVFIRNSPFKPGESLSKKFRFVS